MILPIVDEEHPVIARRSGGISSESEMYISKN